MSLKNLLPVSVGFIVLLSAAIVYAGEKITIVSTDYPPHIWQEGKEVKGLRVELLSELFKRMGYQYIPRIVPWKRAIKEVKYGEVEGIGSIWYKPEREDFLYYPEFTFNIEILGIYQPVGSKEISYRSLEDFKGLQIGVIMGFSYPKAFLESTLFERQEVHSDELNFRKLAYKRVHAVISDSIVADYKIRRLGLQDQIFRNKNNYNEGIWGYIAFSKKNPKGKKLAAEYDRFIQELIKEDFYQNIFRKYMGREPDKLPEAAAKP